MSTDAITGTLMGSLAIASTSVGVQAAGNLMRGMNKMNQAPRKRPVKRRPQKKKVKRKKKKSRSRKRRK